VFHVKTGDDAAAFDLTLGALCERYGLGVSQGGQIAELLAELAANELAPTTVREPLSALEVHVADSLVALDLEFVHRARAIADLGSGAGFPGLALAVALPAAGVVLVESNARKCVFAQGMCRAADIENVQVVCARAEEWAAGLAVHDLVLARAVAPPAVVLEYAAPLLCAGGALVDWRGARAAEQERAALEAAKILGLERLEVRSVEPFDASRDRHLHVYRKVAETPARFPRRVGVARKRPLAGE
jgi:16S rRNA (guanine527-N7)-methyltransferase